MTGQGLTPQQQRFIRDFGYLHLPGLLADRMAEIDATFERVVAANDGDAYDGSHRLTVAPAVNFDAEACRLLLDDPRLDAMLGDLMGRDYQYFSSDFNLCSGDTLWHSDSSWVEGRRTPDWYQVLIYPDPVDAGSGALQVMPGSHHFADRFARDLHAGFMDEEKLMPRRPEDVWGVPIDQMPAVPLPSRPGDVIVINRVVAHAALGGAARRRLINLIFHPYLVTEDLGPLRFAHRLRGFSRSRVVPEGCALLTSADRHRLGHLQQLLAHVPADPTSLMRGFV